MRIDAASGRVTFQTLSPVDHTRVATAVADAGFEVRAWR